MRRRRCETPGSLELLLDTMCNCFGGILFISILLVLLLRNTATVSSAEAAPTTAEQMEAERLRREILGLEAALAVHEAARRADANRTELARSVRVPRLIQEYASAREKTADAQRELDRNRTALEGARARDAEIRAGARLREQGERELRAQIATLEAGLPTLRTAGQRTLRLPRLHRSSKQNYWLLIRAGALHPCSELEAFARGEKAPHSSVTMTTIDNGLQFDAIAGSGQTIEKGFESSGHMAEVLRRLPPSRYSLHFAVYADSYSAFLQVVGLILKHGYSFNWFPMRGGEPLTVRFATAVDDQ
ncbi:MAG: hypothetical protein HZA54_05850 [Planctomycetes bacterium]|nr:hypothetical protein [Planctomycetota bacterium]